MLLNWSKLVLAFVLTVFPVVARTEVQVLATTGMIADAVREIGGELVRVESLMGPGVDPHVYKATHGDMKRLRQAQVVFYNGLHLEGRMVEIFHQLARSKPCIAVASALDETRLLRVDEVDTTVDPHIWFDVALWSTALTTIRDTLVKFDSSNAEQYESNYMRYATRLSELHAWVQARVAEIPDARRVLLTAHDAFGYFGRAYTIEVQGLQGINTAAEFGLYDVKTLVDLVLERDIKAVFVETSVSRKFVEALQEGVRARGGSVQIGGELFSDAMGLEGTAEATYIGMVRHNVNTIVQALH